MNAFVALDCEGPITLNDNAFELAKEFIPQGDRFFSNISKYDDFLADIIKRKGYKAGDTLKLILPFFVAFDIDDRAMEEFSEKTLAFIPSAKKMLEALHGIAPAFIISTSYRPYLEALSRLTGFPLENIYCTEVDLTAYTLSEEEKRVLRSVAMEIAAMPRLSWPDHATDASSLSPEGQKVFERLEEIFWEIIPSMSIGSIFDEVNPIGGPEKALSVDDAAKRTGIGKDRCLYAGDSITDVEAFETVREAGGVTIAFNGNAYALRAAEFALISPSATCLELLIRGFLNRGPKPFKEAIYSMDNPIKGPMLKGLYEALGIDLENNEAFTRYLDDSAIYAINEYNFTSALTESSRMRKLVRGAQIGELG